MRIWGCRGGDDATITHDADLDRARRTITNCNTTLERYRLALEAGTDPALVARWTAKANTERAAAQARLRAPAGRQRMTEQEITDMVTAIGDIVTVLAEADPADKAEIYTQLGLRPIYEPGRHRAEPGTPATPARHPGPRAVPGSRNCPLPTRDVRDTGCPGRPAGPHREHRRPTRPR